MTKEDQLQIACARYLDYQGVLWCHVANERQTSPARGGKLKAMGVKKGVPDILVFEPRGQCPGMAIELKVGRNKTTKEQEGWLFYLQQRGWLCRVVYTLDQFIELVDTYLKGGHKKSSNLFA